MDNAVLIVGVGDGLSASLARELARDHALTLVARDIGKLSDLARETGAAVREGDATDPERMAEIVAGIEDRLAIAVAHPSARTRGALVDLEPAEVRRTLDVSAFGSFVVAQAAARRMLAQEGPVRGTILLTGASAGEKGFPRSAPFAMGKFAQRGLAQSMGRELHPEGIHVCWVNIDGAIRNPGRSEDRPGAMLDPAALARIYRQIAEQDRSTWSNEIAIRPWVEQF